MEAVTMKRPDSGANDTVMTSHNATTNTQKSDGFSADTVGLYQKCLHCKDYGVSCNGPKLAALGDIMIVREFHRAIRDQRAIPMRLIYAAAEPISESTINDYFSHSEKDFKWTTVGCIDNALTAICGNRVGQPPMDHPCPASSTEIQAQIALFEGRIDSLQSNASSRLNRSGLFITTAHDKSSSFALLRLIRSLIRTAPFSALHSEGTCEQV